MRNQKILLTAALGTFVLMAACTKQAPGTPTVAEPGMQTETAPVAQAAPAPVAATTPPPAAVVNPPAAVTRPSAREAAAERRRDDERDRTRHDDRERKADRSAPQQAAIVFVPAGTVLSMSLSTALSTRNAAVGDPVSAVVTNDVMVDGKTVIANGTTVSGSVIKVVSGSDKVGGTPTLAINFERLELPGGKDVPISGEITQSGKSDTTRDTVKIVGGTAAGALVGNKVIKGKKGTVLGGLLGGAIGAVAAKKTGTEVTLDEGTALSLTLDAPVQITR